MKSSYAYKPFRYFFITFLITWTSWFIAAYFSYQDGMEAVQLLFMLPGLCAPFIAVLVMILGPDNRTLRIDFVQRLSFGKIQPRYIPAILLVMPLALFLATALSLAFGQSANQFALSSEFKIMDGQVLVSLLNLFSVIFQTEQSTKIIVTVVLLAMAAIVIAMDKELFSAKLPQGAIS